MSEADDLEKEIEKFVAQDHDRFLEHKVLKVLGIVTRILIYVCLFVILFFNSPDENIYKIPLAQLTLNNIVSLGTWWLLLVVLFIALFKPSQEPDIRKTWSILGIIIACMLFVSLLVFKNPTDTVKTLIQMLHFT